MLLQLDTRLVEPEIPPQALEEQIPPLLQVHQALEQGDVPGKDFLGWLHLPSRIQESLIQRLEEEAQRIREVADCFVVIGIGGSYLGTRAALRFLGPALETLVPEPRNSPAVLFAGMHLSSDYLSELLRYLEGRRVVLNVISKSGTTLEPALAFRILYDWMRRHYGPQELPTRIVVTTDPVRGNLLQMAREGGFPRFEIPPDVGGRYSVLTPVGLLPMAVAGIPIREVLEGAREMETWTTQHPDPRENPATRYALCRVLLHQMGKALEVLAVFHPCLDELAEWWKQLAGESEGKAGKGLYPASVRYTTDLHSLGQWIQEGPRNFLETFLVFEAERIPLSIPAMQGDPDGLGYLRGRSLSWVNEVAWKAVAQAHREGGVPCMRLQIQERSPRALGQLFYFFQRAIALSGLLLGINPFDQPGVEHYKRNMRRLLQPTEESQGFPFRSKRLKQGEPPCASQPEKNGLPG